MSNIAVLKFFPIKLLHTMPHMTPATHMKTGEVTNQLSPVGFWEEFKIFFLTYQVIHDQAQSYLKGFRTQGYC